MYTQPGYHKLQHRILALVTMAILGLFVFAGCNDTTTDPSTAGITSTVDLTMGEVIEKVPISADQAAALAPAFDSWQQQQRSGSAEPMAALGLLANAAEVLTHDQMVALVNLLAEKRQERMKECDNCEAQRRGPGRRGGENRAGGPGRHPGHMGPGGPHGQHGQHGQHGRMGGMGSGLLSQLNLTADQQAAIKTAHEEMRPAMQALFEQFRDGSLTHEEMRDAAKKLHEQMQTTLADILTPEQNAQLAELRDGRVLKNLEKALERLQSHSGAHLVLIAKILKLTDQQVTDATALRQQGTLDLATIIESLRNGQTSGPEAKQAAGDLWEASLAGFRNLLTVEQQELFDALNSMRPRGGHRFPSHP